MKNTILCLLLVSATRLMAQSAFSIQWDTTGLTGTTTAALSGTSVGVGASYITPISFSRGSGLGAASSSNQWSSNSWNSNDAEEYLEFGFTVADGYAVDLSNFLLGTSTSNTGPRDMAITVGENTVGAFQNVNDTFVNTDVDLSDLTSLTGTILFRIVNIGGTVSANGGTIGSTGAFRIGRYNDLEDGLVPTAIYGTVYAVSNVPEPSTSTAIVGAVVLSGVLIRRRRRAVAILR